MTNPSIAIETIEQATRWIDNLQEAQEAGPWNEFGKMHRAFVGFCRVLASDATVVSTLSGFIRSPKVAPQVGEALSAVDQATSGMPEAAPSHKPLFTPPLDDLEARAIHLNAYVRHVRVTQDPDFRESGVVIERSLRLRDRLKDLLNMSTDFDNPGVEAFCVYTYGTLLANTPPTIYGPLLGNVNHMPFSFPLLITSGEAVLNVLRARQAKAAPESVRAKGEKFGILDSPKLLSHDLASSAGVMGTACIYVDIDSFKALNTRYSETVVDRDILPPFQRLLSNSVEGVGFAYAEGGDEVTVLLPNATAEMAAAWCVGFRSLLQERVFSTGDSQVHLTVSVGLSHVESGGDRSALRQQANLAMRKAKELGKDRVCTYSAEGSSASVVPEAC
jgi:diguanylate cyclase (GGDEF)-like protein